MKLKTSLRCGAVLMLGLLGNVAMADPAADQAGAQTMVLTDLATQQQRLLQVLAALDKEPTAENYAGLRSSMARIRQDWDALLAGGEVGQCKLAAPQASQKTEWLALQKQWTQTENAANGVMALEADWRALRGALEQIRTTNQDLETAVRKLIELKQQAGTPAHEAHAAAMLLSLMYRFENAAYALLLDKELNPEPAFLLGKSISEFDDISRGFLTGSPKLHLAAAKGPALVQVLEIVKQFASLKEASNVGLKSLGKSIAHKQALSQAQLDAQPVWDATNKARQALSGGSTCKA